MNRPTRAAVAAGFCAVAWALWRLSFGAARGQPLAPYLAAGLAGAAFAAVGGAAFATSGFGAAAFTAETGVTPTTQTRREPPCCAIWRTSNGR